MITGEATILFVVNTAAACASSRAYDKPQIFIARLLYIAAYPAAKKPLGAVMVVLVI